MFLESDIYDPPNTTFIITPADLAQHVTWMKTVNKKMPAGSNWFIEVGHNGNGNIEVIIQPRKQAYANPFQDAEDADEDGDKCAPGSIEYPDQIDTPLEFVKPIGTGTNLWPSTPVSYPYNRSCTDLDSLKVWWSKPANLNAFAHVSHTFTHEDQDNATYFDVAQEISWNQAWLAQVGIAAADRFSAKGLIPPASMYFPHHKHCFFWYKLPELPELITDQEPGHHWWTKLSVHLTLSRLLIGSWL